MSTREFLLENSELFKVDDSSKSDRKKIRNKIKKLLKREGATNFESGDLEESVYLYFDFNDEEFELNIFPNEFSLMVFEGKVLIEGDDEFLLYDYMKALKEETIK